MNRHNMIWEYQILITEIYKEHELTSLRGLNHEYEVNGKQIIMWHHEVTRKCSVKNNRQFEYSKNFDDLLFCSDELLYFTAHLYLYKPFINNPLDDSFHVEGRMVYPNNQSLGAKRFNMFASVTSQIAYNFWDRIGDLIASFFPDNFKPYDIHFPKAIDAIPTDFQNEEGYLWLKKLKKMNI